MDHAAELGRFQIIQWLHKNRFIGCTTTTMDAAVANGHLELVKWLHTHRSKEFTTEAMDRAAANGHLEVIRWLGGCTVREFEEAIKRQDVKMVKTLYQSRPGLSQWPQPEHASIIKDLLLSWYPDDKKILDCVMNCRHERYSTLKHTKLDEEKELEDHGGTRCNVIYELSLVQFVLNHKGSQSIGMDVGCIITQYLIRDPRELFDTAEAVLRGYVHWLELYRSHENVHLRRLTFRGNFDGARRVHEFMDKTSPWWICDDHFKELAMERGDLSFIQLHVRNCSSANFEEVARLAVWTGRKDVIRWIQTFYKNGKKSTSGGARWLLEPSLTDMDKAAAENDLPTVKRLHGVMGEKGNCTTKVMDLAAANGHLKMVEWLNEHRVEGCTTDAMDGAASNGHLEILKWLRCSPNRKEGFTSLAMDGAAANGHLQVVEWLYRIQRDGSIEYNALAPDLRQEEERQIQRFSDSVGSIADNIRSHRHSRLDLAAYHGHFEVVQFLHENQDGSVVAAHAMNLAATIGHLEIVQFLHQNRREGCTATAIYGALHGKHYEVALYLYKHRPECAKWPKEEKLPSLVSSMLTHPITPVVVELLRFILTHRKLRLSPCAMDKASLDNNSDLVRALHDLDLGGCTTAAMDFAAMNGNLELVHFLHFNRDEGCTTDAMDGASEAGHSISSGFSMRIDLKDALARPSIWQLVMGIKKSSSSSISTAMKAVRLMQCTGQL